MSPSPEQQARGVKELQADRWAAIFAETPRLWRQPLLKCVNFSAPPSFLDFVCQAQPAMPRQTHPATALLLEADLISIVLLSPEILPLDEAVAAARQGLVLDPKLDTRLLRRVTRPGRLWPEEIGEPEMARLLDILASLPRIYPSSAMMLYRFLKVDRPKIRSRAVKVVTSAMERDDWTESALQDPDPRVRANLLEGLSKSGPPSARAMALFRRATRDAHHRVRVTALLALVRMGERGAELELRALAERETGDLGRAARWAIRSFESQPEPLESYPT
jgi:hypothetical protein